MQYIGALIGDYCGSIYEWNNSHEENPNTIEILKHGKLTDDSVLTVAVMDWLIETKGEKTISPYLKKWAKKYPNAGYGGKFKTWILSNSNEIVNYR